MFPIPTSHRDSVLIFIISLCEKCTFYFQQKLWFCFPGGFGTLDELFTALTLRQTGRMQKIPIILYATDYWKNIINFEFLADEGVISDEHLDLIFFTDSPQETLRSILSITIRILQQNRASGSCSRHFMTEVKDPSRFHCLFEE